MDSSEISKATLTEYSYKRGTEDERSKWRETLLPGTVQLQISVRGEKDDVETIRRVVSFDIIRESRAKALRLEWEETLAKIATTGILKSLIEGTYEKTH